MIKELSSYKALWYSSITHLLEVSLLNPLLALALLLPTIPPAQHHTGIVHTPEVDLGYETFGTQGSALPIIAVNGGPGLSHAYMLQNDIWQRLSAHRLVVFYDQRGTGASKRLQPNAPQTIDAQVADLDALRTALHLDRIALLGDSYGGLLSMAYASAHPEHIAKLILSDSPGPSWNSIVHLFPQVFPDQEERGDAEKKSLLAIARSRRPGQPRQPLPYDLLLVLETRCLPRPHGRHRLCPCRRQRRPASLRQTGSHRQTSHIPLPNPRPHWTL
jgi:pimeloyl-ACP methyl ester carboxylesterase